MTRRPPRPPSKQRASAEVVIVMGLAGSGKTRLAESFVARGFDRLNRDAVGGTLKGLAQKLDALLAGGAKRVVLDNTYVTRASRSEVLRIACTRNALVRCILLETPLAEAQVNVTGRMLDRHGELLGGAELKKRAKLDANLFEPSVLHRMDRQFELPSVDEGFASIEIASFVRIHEEGRASVALPIELLLVDHGGAATVRDDARDVLSNVPADVPLFVFAWRPGADDAWRVRVLEKIRKPLGERPVIELGVCVHPGGPPVCWCRPPLPGLWLSFARRNRIDPRRSLLIATSMAHKTMAATLGIKTM